MNNQAGRELRDAGARSSALRDPAAVKFADSIAEELAVPRDRALEVAGVVLCTVLWEAPQGALEAMRDALPPEIGRILSRCRDIRGNTVALTTPENIVTAIARRMDVAYMEAERYTRVVVETAREFVGWSNAQRLAERMGME